MITATAQKKLIAAIRQGLNLSHRQAVKVLTHNWILLATSNKRYTNLSVVPHLSKPVLEDETGIASLYINDEFDCHLTVPAGLMQPIQTCSLARAYGLPNDLVEWYENEFCTFA